MNVDNNDWLDERLAVKAYLPDDGFTARVLERLPQTQPLAVVERRRILAVSSALAALLFVAQTFAMLRGGGPAIGHLLSPEFASEVAALSRQPIVFAGISGGMALLGLSVVPFLRRWV
jgi:hypothetical protein